jgi:hypothetical protein
VPHDFTKFEEDPEPQPFGRRSGPPGKFTAAGVSDPSASPNIRCFGCGEMMVDIGVHVENCAKISAKDLARFQEARRKFQSNPGQAFDVARTFLDRQH